MRMSSSVNVHFASDAVSAYHIVSGSCSSRPMDEEGMSGRMEDILWNVEVRKSLDQFARGLSERGCTWEEKVVRRSLCGVVMSR